jgi:hypothetical protein
MEQAADFSREEMGLQVVVRCGAPSRRDRTRPCGKRLDYAVVGASSDPNAHVIGFLANGTEYPLGRKISRATVEWECPKCGARPRRNAFRFVDEFRAAARAGRPVYVT